MFSDLQSLWWEHRLSAGKGAQIMIRKTMMMIMRRITMKLITREGLLATLRRGRGRGNAKGARQGCSEPSIYQDFNLLSTLAWTFAEIIAAYNTTKVLKSTRRTKVSISTKKAKTYYKVAESAKKIIGLLGSLSEKKYGIFWEFFPNVGPPPPPLFGRGLRPKTNLRVYFAF